MFKNYLKIAFRNLKKDKQFTFLNVVGLSAGIACTLLIYLWLHDELSYDKFFANDSQIYQIMEHRKSSAGVLLSDESSGLVSETVKIQDPEVVYAASVAPPDWFQKFTLTSGDKNIKAVGQYAGKDYFNIFSFNMVAGDRRKVLAVKNSIVISDELAKKLFNTTEAAIGKVVKFQHEKDFFISGVFEKVPSHSSQQFDFVLSFDYLADIPAQSWVKTWNNMGPHNYVLLKKDADVNTFNNKIAGIVTKGGGDTTRSLFAMRFSDNYLHNTFIHGFRISGRDQYVKLFSIIALFILVIACINFMNLSTAKASGRMKEVGVKKVVGAGRSQLIFQFLSESLLLAVFTTIVAVLIGWLLLPQFNLLTGKDIHLRFDAPLILTLISITVFTGLVSGSYPALYLSKFNPLAILKGKFDSSLSELIARKGLVVFQFSISVMLIVAVLVVYKQIQFIQATTPGYNKDNVIRFDSEGALMGKEETFAAALKTIPGVVNASFTQHNIVGRNYATTGLSWDGNAADKNVYFEGFFGGYNFIETMGMQLTGGRSFSKDFAADGNNLILNEAAVKVMHLKDPVAKTIKGGNNNIQIIGVVKDFHFESLHEAVKPAFIALAQGQSPWYKMMIRIKGDHQKETIAQVQKLYESYNPGFPFSYNFLDEAYQKQYETEVRVSKLSEYFSMHLLY